MSGHSKWANIKRKKEANDKVKGALFAKLSRLIMIAVAEGGGVADPEHNFKLRLLVDKARDLNMPKENIKRALEKGSGAGDKALKEVVYEGFAPHGVALLIQTTTDNPNRTVSELKNHMEMHGGKLGAQGAVSYLFDRCVAIEIDSTKYKEEDILAYSEALSALDLEQSEGKYYVYIPFDQFGKAKDSINGISPNSVEVDYKPQMLVHIEDENSAKQIIQLIESLEDLSDVHHVFSNMS